jgi:hypothetical protein
VGNSVNKRKEQKMFELRIYSFQNKKSSVSERLKGFISNIKKGCERENGW